ncbi:MAG: virulence factor TspB C-terminal domain-related protein [Lautropia sp.]|nr:virulence factor TspB C-terminal domain-related protein [Lautropia sp.]
MHADLGKQGEVIVTEHYQCPEGATLFEPGKCSLEGKNKDGEPLTEDQAVDLLSGKMPPTIPPGITIPVDNPVWNPSPGPNPKPRPVVTPIGDPVPSVSTEPAPSPLTPQPGADPQTQTQRITWTQPAVEIVHSPTEDQPLRLEVRPIDVPVAGPNSRLKPETDGKPEPAPGGNPNGPGTGSDKPPTDAKPDDRPGLCEEYPDILACKELDEVDADEVPDMEMPISLEMAPGFARAGQCPADKTLTVMGKAVSLSWRPICDLASGVRPVVIAFAALSAVAIVIGIARRDG